MGDELKHKLRLIIQYFRESWIIFSVGIHYCEREEECEYNQPQLLIRLTIKTPIHTLSYELCSPLVINPVRVLVGLIRKSVSEEK